MTILTDATAPAVRDLSALFDPSSVAVIGASNDQTKYGNWLSVQALRGEHRRPVHLVNRRGEPVLGRAVHRQAVDAPGGVDLAVIAVPAAGFADAVEDALAAGARAIVGITAGFAELGEEGRAREDALARRIRRAGAVLLGPNCLGVLDTTTELRLASNDMPVGGIGFVSQSGNMALELSRFLERDGLGFSRFASLGNQADLTAADLVRSYTEHDGTELIALYCEDFGDGRAFARAAADAVRAGKPLALLTVGAGQASMRGARSHTGALTSDLAVIDAACRAAGVDRVATVAELAHLLGALYRNRRGGGRRVAVIADGGGHASLASDVAEARGLHVPEFDDDLVARLKAELPPSAGTANPVDLAGAGEQDITSFGRVLDLALGADSVDSVLVTGYFGGYGGYGEALAEAEVATARVMAARIRHHGKPVAVHTMYADAPAAVELRRQGVCVFGSVEHAAQVLGRIADRAERTAPHVPAVPAPAAPVAADDYWTARELLRQGGLDFPAAHLVRTQDEAAAAAARIDGPVVLKAMGLLHKSDAGGVALGLADEASVRAAHADMARRLDPPGYCIEAMADTRDGVELIVGVRRDPRFGPVALVGLGGIFTEVLRDVRLGLAPVTATDARALLERLTAAPLLHGVRGRPAVHLAAAARAIEAITSVAAAHPEIAELEVNPLLVTPRGCTGLDARIVLDA
ncbi:Protein lysine acetyltransferase Pka [Streptomyces sp. RB17]|uniref:acetate--CoA ligase family protein n=1 Tax=Streptomyces sp. RB17 TaxID=2585197 RepID=UPI0013096F74|nr:acetate--CoA ligase family protein [Streptomyces sp. RB17]MQY40137.1 Protein lysine acetyltransferase Pka [Streptomyces sp. RB17]